MEVPAQDRGETWQAQGQDATVDSMKRYPADLPDIQDAARRIAGLAHRTPVATCRTLDRLAG